MFEAILGTSDGIAKHAVPYYLPWIWICICESKVKIKNLLYQYLTYRESKLTKGFSLLKNYVLVKIDKIWGFHISFPLMWPSSDSFLVTWELQGFDKSLFQSCGEFSKLIRSPGGLRSQLWVMSPYLLLQVTFSAPFGNIY